MIDETEALRIVHAEAETLGWPFLAPFSIRRRKRWFRVDEWEIVSNAKSRGMSCRFVIDAKNGNVIEKAYRSR